MRPGLQLAGLGFIVVMRTPPDTGRIAPGLCLLPCAVDWPRQLAGLGFDFVVPETAALRLGPCIMAPGASPMSAVCGILLLCIALLPLAYAP